MRKCFRGVLFATVLPSLGGCITAGDFNKKIADTGTTVVIGSPVSACARAKAEYALSPTTMPPAAVNASLSGNQRNRTDLQLGLSMLASATSGSAVPASAAAYDDHVTGFSQGLFARLGIDPSGIEVNLDALAPDAVDRANQVLTSTLFRDLAPADPAVTSSKFGGGEITISRREWTGMIQDVSFATSGEGWVGAAAQALGHYAKTYGLNQITTTTQAQDAAQVTLRLLVARYVSDYFRNGKIVTLDFDYPDLKSKLLDKLKKSIKDETVLTAADAQIDQLAKDLGQRLCQEEGKVTPCRILGVLGEQTFVSRAGKSYGFPGLAATVDLAGDKKVSTNKIDPNAVVSDLVRVLFEATGDDRIRVPGAKNSSLCRASASMCAGKDNTDKLKQVDNIGDRAEAGTFAAVGIAIRGGWLFSINNEALATSIQTAVAVGVRKTAEGVMWSRLQNCPANLAALASVDASPRTVTLRLTE